MGDLKVQITISTRIARVADLKRILNNRVFIFSLAELPELAEENNNAERINM